MTTAGLLMCDHIEKAYQNRFGDYSSMFSSVFPNFRWKHYDVTQGVLPQSTNECQIYICTGSRRSVYEHLDWLIPLKEFIRNLFENKVLFVGVCFGHQLLAETLGGRVEKSSSGWTSGIHNLVILQSRPWMRPFHSQVKLPMMCQDQVTELPPGAQLLGTTGACTNAFFSMDEFMLGIQGHPEFTNPFLESVLINRRELIGEEKYQMSIESLKTHKTTFFGPWIEQFISNLYSEK